MAAAGDATTTPISRAGHLLANSSFSPRLVSLHVEVNRTLEPALGKIDAVCDNMCHFSKILADLQKQQELIQQQIEEKETEVKASDIVDIRRRQAALEQRVLNLQIHFQDFIDSHTQLQALCQQQQTRALHAGKSSTGQHSDDPTYDLSCDRLTLIDSGQQDPGLNLTTLHTALEKRTQTVYRGSWG